MKTTFAALSIMLVMSLTMCTNLFAQWTNGQNATYVIGQAGFASSAPGTTATTLRYPFGVAIDVANGKLYLSDASNYRILRYSYPISGNQPTAELVFGQSDMTSGSANAGGLSASSLNAPSGLFVDSTGRLWVVDRNNHRVLWFNNAYSISTNKPDADGVLGQADFSSGSANRGDSVGRNTLYQPFGLCVDASGNLFVADFKNNRVLRFDSAASKGDGADADGVLGQPDFTSNSATTTQNGMKMPIGLAMSGTTLFVSSYGNNRILRFDSAASKGDGANADGVLGQADFSSGLANRGGSTAQNSFNLPKSICRDAAGRLYVADIDNNRVVTFDNAASKGNGADADNVLGQPNFMSSSAATTQSGMRAPDGVAVDSGNDKLFVVDTGNHRALQFNADSSLPVELSSFTATSEGNTVTLYWRAETEVNNVGFSIYRNEQKDGKYTKITFVHGAGNSGVSRDYQFMDKGAEVGKTYFYYLEDIDISGEKSKSEIIKVVVSPVPTEVVLKEFRLLQNYPNPFNPETWIPYQLASDTSDVSIVIYNIGGQIVRKLRLGSRSAGTYLSKERAAHWDGRNDKEEKVSSGVYLCTLKVDGRSVATRRLLVIK